MRVVLDTNIFLSALISRSGVADRILKAWRGDRFEVVTSRHQIEELRRASRYEKFRKLFRPAQVGEIVNNLARAVVLEKLTIREEADDDDDSFLLAMAVAGDADYLVTGDKQAGLLKMKRFGITRIVTPAQFLRHLR